MANININDYVQINSSKSKYNGYKGYIIAFTTQQRVRIMLDKTNDNSSCNKVNILIKQSSVNPISDAVFSNNKEYNKIVNKDELCNYLGKTCYISESSKSKYAGKLAIFNNYTTNDRLMLQIGNDITTVKRQKVLFKDNKPTTHTNDNNIVTNTNNADTKINIAKIAYVNDMNKLTYVYCKLTDDNFKVGDFVLLNNVPDKTNFSNNTIPIIEDILTISEKDCIIFIADAKLTIIGKITCNDTNSELNNLMLEAAKIINNCNLNMGDKIIRNAIINLDYVINKQTIVCDVLHNLSLIAKKIGLLLNSN